MSSFCYIHIIVPEFVRFLIEISISKQQAAGNFIQPQILVITFCLLLNLFTPEQLSVKICMTCGLFKNYWHVLVFEQRIGFTSFVIIFFLTDGTSGKSSESKQRKSCYFLKTITALFSSGIRRAGTTITRCQVGDCCNF